MVGWLADWRAGWLVDTQIINRNKNDKVHIQHNEAYTFLKANITKPETEAPVLCVLNTVYGVERWSMILRLLK